MVLVFFLALLFAWLGFQSSTTIMVNVCEDINASHSLYTSFCTEFNSNVVALGPHKVTLVTSVDSRIQSYASYSTALLQLYALHNEYTFQLYCSDDYLDEDGRWTKVRIMRQLVNQHNLNSSANKSHSDRYVVWIDADLIFLDLSYRITSLIEAYPDYDMLISAEQHGGSGVANTGCFVLKFTPYTQFLLNTWWDTDHFLGHDQVLFNHVYRALFPGIRSHVKILPTSALNSLSPPYAHYSPSMPILHLMGESNEVRRNIFSYAVRSACNRSGLAQFGLTRDIIRDLTLESNLQSLHRQNSSLLQITQIESIEEILNTVTSYREILLSIQRITLSASPPVQVLDMFHEYLFLYSTLLCRTSLIDMLSMQGSTLSFNPCVRRITDSYNPMALSSSSLVQALYTLSMLGNDLVNEYIQSIPFSVNIECLFADLTRLLAFLEKRVEEDSIVIIKENEAMLWFNRGEYYTKMNKLTNDDNMIEKALLAYEKSLLIYRGEIPIVQQNRYHHVMPLLSYSSLLCSIKEKRKEGVESYKELRRVLEDLLDVEEQEKVEHESYRKAMEGLQECEKGTVVEIELEDTSGSKVQGTLQKEVDRIRDSIGNVPISGTEYFDKGTRKRFKRRKGS